MGLHGALHEGVAHGIRRLSTMGLAALLGACATAPTAPPDRSYAGRFSATALGSAAPQNVSGRFSLEVRGAEQVFDLSTPLGTTVARVEINASGARARGPQLEEMRGDNADALVEQLLGWRLPISGLSDWIEGRAAAGRPARVEKVGARTVLIEQDGWTIRIVESFEPSGPPRRLVLDRPAVALQPAVTVRLIVDDPS